MTVKKPGLIGNQNAKTNVKKIKTHCRFTVEFAELFPKGSNKKAVLIEKGVKLAMDQNPEFREEVEALKNN